MDSKLMLLFDPYHFIFEFLVSLVVHLAQLNSSYLSINLQLVIISMDFPDQTTC